MYIVEKTRIENWFDHVDWSSLSLLSLDESVITSIELDCDFSGDRRLLRFLRWWPLCDLDDDDVDDPDESTDEVELLLRFRLELLPFATGDKLYVIWAMFSQ